ncbi:hypothetical protein [Psychrobacter sp. DM4]|uniref:hypothetical protein n=1 Tax=Psychrobacter sp. DM4 TaxID=3440637 RepID=UPI003F4FA957
MFNYEDPIAAFGSAEEGNDPLKPYLDPTLYDIVDRDSQIKMLTAVFDAITLGGVDYDLNAQTSTTGKMRYTLTKNGEVVTVLFMETNFSDLVVDAINKTQKS